MAIRCPYCGHGMAVKDAKPGRYKPRCSKCGRRFALTIWPDASRDPLAVALPEETLPETASPGDTPAASPTPTQPAEAPKQNSTEVSMGAPQASPLDQTLPLPAAPATVPDVGATLPEAPIQKVPIQLTRPSVPTSTTRTAVEATLPVASQDTLPAGAGASGTAVSSAAAPSVSASETRTRKSADQPDRIGGYKILQELGRGAMGAVYLARQLSLDREVALKTIQSQWASHPTFVARFVREAYAAAQLTHHNIVQIYDMGVDSGTNYFSMEFVRGESLDVALRRAGRLTPEAAVGYILQAARGLHYAHQHGMVHRDVKPANMIVDVHGTLKIADLGLVKWAGANGNLDEPASSAGESSAALAQARSDVTLANVAMGTPAYMAPEQAENAAGVDHRADIYSLGCALYALITGRAPFDGATVIEVLSKHRSQPVIRPDTVIAEIPKELAEITLRMIAKDPAQRYQNLNELVVDLERFLNAAGPRATGFTEEHATRVADLARRFQASSLVKTRDLLPFAWLALGGLLTAATFWWSLALASGLAFGWAIAAVAYLVAGGSEGASPVLERVRAVLFSTRWTDWLTWLGGGVVGVLGLWLVGWIWIWIGAAIVGMGLGVACAVLIDRRLAAGRRPVLDETDQLLRGLRLRGTDEAALRRFVAEHAGRDWEEFCETLFGYEAKLELRAAVAQSPTGSASRRKFRAWREPLIGHLDRRLRAEQGERARRHLSQVEEQGLRAEGVDPRTAKEQAGRLAQALVGESAARRSGAVHAAQTMIDPAAAAAEKRERIKRMLAEAKGGASAPRPSLFASLATSAAFAPVRFAFSGKVRFLLGCFLLVGCALWARQNGLLAGDDWQSVASTAGEQLRGADVGQLTRQVKLGTAEPLAWPGVGRFFDSWYPGIAGMLLVLAGFFRGSKMSWFAVPAAGLIVAGPLFGPRVVMLVAGIVLALVGFVFGRTSS